MSGPDQIYCPKCGNSWFDGSKSECTCEFIDWKQRAEKAEADHIKAQEELGHQDVKIMELEAENAKLREALYGLLRQCEGLHIAPGSNIIEQQRRWDFVLHAMQYAKEALEDE